MDPLLAMVQSLVAHLILAFQRSIWEAPRHALGRAWPPGRRRLDARHTRSAAARTGASAVCGVGPKGLGGWRGDLGSGSPLRVSDRLALVPQDLRQCLANLL